MAGVRLDYPQDAVKARLGAPRRSAPPAWLFGAPLRGGVSFDSRLLAKAMWTRSRDQRTSRGVGPGARRRKVARAYPKARCHRSRSQRRKVICVIGGRFHGRPVETAFVLRRNVVREVEVYFP